MRKKTTIYNYWSKEFVICHLSYSTIQFCAVPLVLVQVESDDDRVPSTPWNYFSNISDISEFFLHHKKFKYLIPLILLKIGVEFYEWLALHNRLNSRFRTLLLIIRFLCVDSLPVIKTWVSFYWMERHQIDNRTKN